MFMSETSYCLFMFLTEWVFFLQPLMDNLESQTYEVFEKDPIKYSQYQQVRVVGQLNGKSNVKTIKSLITVS